MEKLYFDFYGHKVKVESDWSEILVLLKKNFSLFQSEQDLAGDKLLQIRINHIAPPQEKIPNIISSMQTLSSITYQQGHIRYNDYYGKLLTIFDYKNEKAELYGNDLDKMHEIAYLLILSRVGKSQDKAGVHKLHAFAVSYQGKAFVCMMPTKGGKSTLLLELLKLEGVKMLSDDIPLVNSRGDILSFPIKIGLEDSSKSYLDIKNPEENIYYLKREQFGRKMFICLDGIMAKVEVPGKTFSNIILAEGFRSNTESSSLVSSSWLKTFKGLFKHGIIGVGLPMMIEYFWEFGIKDFFVKAKIFILRSKSFLCLSLKSKRVTLKLGRNPEQAAKEIIHFIENMR